MSSKLRPGPTAAAAAEVPLLAVEGLSKHYRLPRQRLFEAAPQVRALQEVSFTLAAGRSLGVVGESGSGKSTLARQVMALESPSAGQVRFEGQVLHRLQPAALKRARAGFQMVFQDPFGSLDPRQRVGRIVAEPLAAQGAPAAEQAQRAAAMLEAVGLHAADVQRYPHEFSGGQRQRIAIARALVTHPKLIVADEPVSALDVSVQAQVLNLMQSLQEQLGLSYLFISHDLAVVDLVSDEVLVLFQGRVVEQAPTDVLFRQAAHPYTRLLMLAAPQARAAAPPHPPLGPEPAMPLPATVPAQACAFVARCPLRQPRCLEAAPALVALSPSHRAACHRAEEVAAGRAVVAVPARRRAQNAGEPPPPTLAARAHGLQP